MNREWLAIMWRVLLVGVLVVIVIACLVYLVMNGWNVS